MLSEFVKSNYYSMKNISLCLLFFFQDLKGLITIKVIKRHG